MTHLLLLVVILPAVAGTATFFIGRDSLRHALWGLTAAVHFGLALWSSASGLNAPPEGWLGIDSLAAVFLILTSFLFLGTTLYGIGYINRERTAPGIDTDYDEDTLFRHVPEAVFTGCLLLFLASMSLVILSRHFALQWVAIEATTLTSTPLIYFHRHRQSLEAAWKYLIICSVAIALALPGVFFIAMAVPSGVAGFTVDVLVAHAGSLNTHWLELAFIFLIVGYGAKMGLAPMHTWLPDAHSEAPAPVSALLSGGLLNCSFLGILRLQQVCVAAGIGAFGQQLLLVFGLLSMGLAAVFMLRAVDYKRMLAYSSIEHMGILAAGVGLGGIGVFGAILHAVNHSLVKTLLFLNAGNILTAYHTKRIRDVGGLFGTLPVTGVLWFAGFLAIAGSPPFGTFLSEFTILRASIDQGRWITSAAYVTFLTVAFVGMLKPFIGMSFGEPGREPVREPKSSILPQMILIGMSLLLGLHVPEHLMVLLDSAARSLGGAGL